MPKNTWNKIWKKQAESKGLFDKLLWVLRRNTSKKYAEKISKLLDGKASPRILEIGCGSAATFQYLREKIPNASLTGLDFSPMALELASKNNPATKFIEGDARKLPLKSNQYDLVYSLGLIEHFSREDAKEIILEHARTTKKGGIVIIVVPAKYSALNLVRIIAGKSWPWGFEDPFTKKELRRLMRSAGLGTIKVERIKTIVLFAMGIKNGQ
jgi:ubiquinone/menaquinone biosynthesis C-methylase UbiE